MRLLECREVTKTFADGTEALRQVSLPVDAGEAVSIIGRNGAGKTTLLKVIAGITLPDAGEVRRPVRTASVIELGAGFAPDLTGRENLELGLVMAEVGRRLRMARRAALADLEPISDALDTPIKRWSSGMLARLAFTVAFRSEPELLIIDEVLAVGDTAFQRSVSDQCRLLLDRGGSLLLTTHDMRLGSHLTTRTLWLDEGAPRALGPAKEVIDAYETEVCGFSRWRSDDRLTVAKVALATDRPQPGGPLALTGEIHVVAPVDGIGVRADIRPQVGTAPWERTTDETALVREFTTCARTAPHELGALSPGIYRVRLDVDRCPVASADVALSMVLVDLESGELIDEASIGARIGSDPGFPGHHVELSGAPTERPDAGRPSAGRDPAGGLEG